MKILFSWLFDYIDCLPSQVDVAKMIHLFNIRTAEIESFETVSVDYKAVFAGQVVAIDGQKVTFNCPEKSAFFTLPFRSDVVVGKWYLAALENSVWRWVVLADFCSDKEGIMPAVSVAKNDQAGGWKSKVAAIDYALDVDNKSINHRPDLWGHYGIAREIATFLNLPLKALESNLSEQTVLKYALKSEDVLKNGLSVVIKNSESCSRVAAMLCDDIVFQDSDLFMAIRLASIGAKPINAVVDLTNYVMFDVGHPMHVFDAGCFEDKTLMVRSASSSESLELLDGKVAKLTEQDLVITNKSEVLSIAGVMGGKSSGYKISTTSIVVVAEGFDPATIRKTAQRLKLRTEACTRFEKHLDPMQNIVAIKRFLKLAQDLNILPGKLFYPIISVGAQIEPKTCVIGHQFIESRLGMSVKSEFVQSILERLGFGVLFCVIKKEYTVTIPTIRATKDVKIVEDILEEIVRSYGFENIIPQLPDRQTAPFGLQPNQNIRQIKRYLAHGMGMHEVRDYMLYDASWVSRFSIDMTMAVAVKSPLSENWTTLVTTLIVHLLKSVERNSSQKEHLRFFEYARTWKKIDGEYIEQKVAAGIIFDKKAVDFYTCKSELQGLWDLLGINVVYRKPDMPLPIWYDKHQAAELLVDGKVIGIAGIMSVAWSSKAVEGSAFIFEIDGEFLESLQPKVVRFISSSKFQEVCYDISLFVPLSLSSDKVLDSIKNAHPDIKNVSVVDFFEKPEWTEHRAITARYSMSSDEKTMTKQDIDAVVLAVGSALKEYNVQIR